MTSRNNRIPVVYLITCKINNKIYVGSARSFYKRYCDYVQKSKHPSTPIERAIHKHGLDNFVFSILERLPSDNKTILLAREQYWIDTLQPFTSTQKGYNVCTIAGSCQGVTHSVEMRQRLSATKRSQKRGQSVIQIDPKNLCVIAEYDSCERAAEALKISPQSIREVLRGICILAGKFTWCYKSKYDPASFVIRPRKQRGGPANGRIAKPVIQMDMDGNQLRVWDHVKIAATTLGVGMHGIYNTCQRQTSCAFGFKWAYSNDPILTKNVNQRRKEEWKIAHNL